MLGTVAEGVSAIWTRLIAVVSQGDLGDLWCPPLCSSLYSSLNIDVKESVKEKPAFA